MPSPLISQLSPPIRCSLLAPSCYFKTLLDLAVLISHLSDSLLAYISALSLFCKL